MLTKKIGGKFERNNSEDSTHLVILCDSNGIPKTTIKFHQAILSGITIVSYTCSFIYFEIIESNYDDNNTILIIE